MFSWHSSFSATCPQIHYVVVQSSKLFFLPWYGKQNCLHKPYENPIHLFIPICVIIYIHVYTYIYLSIASLTSADVAACTNASVAGGFTFAGLPGLRVGCWHSPLELSMVLPDLLERLLYFVDKM